MFKQLLVGLVAVLIFTTSSASAQDAAVFSVVSTEPLKSLLIFADLFNTGITCQNSTECEPLDLPVFGGTVPGKYRRMEPIAHPLHLGESLEFLYVEVARSGGAVTRELWFTWDNVVENRPGHYVFEIFQINETAGPNSLLYYRLMVEMDAAGGMSNGTGSSGFLPPFFMVEGSRSDALVEVNVSNGGLSATVKSMPAGYNYVLILSDLVIPTWDAKAIYNGMGIGVIFLHSFNMTEMGDAVPEDSRELWFSRTGADEVSIFEGSVSIYDGLGQQVLQHQFPE